MINLDNLFALSVEAYEISSSFPVEGSEEVLGKVYPTAEIAELAYNEAMIPKGLPGLNHHKLYIKPVIVYQPDVQRMHPGEYNLISLVASLPQLEKRKHYVFNEDTTKLIVT